MQRHGFIRWSALSVAALLCGCALRAGGAVEITHAQDASRETIQTLSGPVRGSSASLGRAFLGLPFAAPPVGALRFRPPQPLSPWPEPREAVKPGPDCVQAIGPGAFANKGGGYVFGSEDCLYLNVYTPPKIEQPPAGGWPVMVFIPGGAFVLGAGDNYDLSRLASGDHVVAVTVNYRLGPFGFYAHPALTRESPTGGSGNFGLLDQQAALHWIHDNIGAFGGDAARVTLFGESAGAWSVCDQMIAPGAAGLFSRAILESGSCLDRRSSVSIAAAEDKGSDFAASLGCGDPESVLTCLRAAPTKRIARARSTRRGIEGPSSWGPVWGDAVLPLAPDVAFNTGRYAAMPLIIGSNHDEGRIFATAIKGPASYEKQVEADFGDQAQRVLAQYPASQYGEPRLAYAAIVTDARFACPSQALRIETAGKAPVYGYEFADANPPITLPRFMTGGPMGAYHTSELIYVFGTRWVLADPKAFTTDQRALSGRMMDAWGRFARGDAPAPEWRPFSDGGYLLRLAPEGDGPTSQFLDRHNCAFWRSVPGW